MKRQQQQPKISSFFNKKAKTTPAPAPAAAPPVVDLTAEDEAPAEPWRPALDPATVPENARAALNNAHDAMPESGQRAPPPRRRSWT